MKMRLQHFSDEWFKLHAQSLPDRNNRSHPLDEAALFRLGICLGFSTQAMNQLDWVNGVVDAYKENYSIGILVPVSVPKPQNAPIRAQWTWQ